MRKNVLLLAVITVLIVAGCSLVPQSTQPTPSGGDTDAPVASGLSSDAAAIAQERGLSPDDITAALKTYMPTGVHDEYIIFSSAGHGGASSRILKNGFADT